MDELLGNILIADHLNGERPRSVYSALVLGALNPRPSLEPVLLGVLADVKIEHTMEQ